MIGSNRVQMSKHLNAGEVIDPIWSKFEEENEYALKLTKNTDQRFDEEVPFKIDNTVEKDIFKKIEEKSFDFETDFNQVIPMLFAGISYGNKMVKSNDIKVLEQFYIKDPNLEYIKNPLSVKTLMFIWSVYLESKSTNKILLNYWIWYLMYFTNSRDGVFENDKYYADCLFAAYLIDNKQFDKARELLEKVEKHADFRADINLERIHSLLLGHMLKRNKNDHRDFTKGLQLLEKHDKINEADKYAEWSHFFVANPDKYIL